MSVTYSEAVAIARFTHHDWDDLSDDDKSLILGDVVDELLLDAEATYSQVRRVRTL